MRIYLYGKIYLILLYLSNFINQWLISLIYHSIINILIMCLYRLK